MPTPQELAYIKAAQAVNSIIASGNQPDTATLANLAKAKKALATIGKDPAKAGSVSTALTQSDEETGDYDNHDDVERDPGEDAEFDDDERHGDANGRWSDKRTGRSHRDDQGDDEDAEEFVFGTKVQVVGPRGQKWSGIVVDPVDIIDSEENGEIDTGGAASDALAQDLTLIQTDDGEYHAVPSSVVKVISRNGEDAESKPEPHAWSPSCDCPKCQAAYAKENERRRKTGLSHESVNISSFLKSVSQKNYALANKYLQAVVDGKLKRSISNAANK